MAKVEKIELGALKVNDRGRMDRNEIIIEMVDEMQKRQALARFQKEMDAYGLRVTPKVAVMASSEPNTVMLVMQTEAYPVRGYGSHIKQLKAAGFWVLRWRQVETVKRRNRTISTQKGYFQVTKVRTTYIHSESGVRV